MYILIYIHIIIYVLYDMYTAHMVISLGIQWEMCMYMCTYICMYRHVVVYIYIYIHMSMVYANVNVSK